MALKVLLLRKKLTDKQTELRTLEKAAEGFEAREQELAADIEAAQTDEERSAVEGAVEAFETERSDNDQQRAAIRAAIEALEAEIRTAEDAAKDARTGKPAGNERKDVTHMETAETRTRFFGLTIQERDAFIQREDVQAFLTRVREMKGQNRSVTGAELGIPTVMLDLLRENIGRYSKLISRVRYKPLKGKARQNIAGTVPAAIWTESVASLNELELSFTQMEMDGYKVGGYQPGDVVIYDFPGGALTDHCGIVETATSSFVTAIEGNTAVGNDSNGGEVMRRTRSVKQVVGAVRPQFEEEEDENVVRYKFLADIPVTFRPTIGTLMDAGIIQGDGSDPTGNGDVIDLSHDQVRTLVFAYRGGAFDAKLRAAGLTPAVQ